MGPIDLEILVVSRLGEQPQRWANEVRSRLPEASAYDAQKFMNNIIRDRVREIGFAIESKEDIPLLTRQTREGAMRIFLLSDEELRHDFRAFIKDRETDRATPMGEKFLKEMKDQEPVQDISAAHEESVSDLTDPLPQRRSVILPKLFPDFKPWAQQLGLVLRQQNLPVPSNERLVDIIIILIDSQLEELVQQGALQESDIDLALILGKKVDEFLEMQNYEIVAWYSNVTHPPESLY